MNIWILNHYAQTKGGFGSTRHFDLAREIVKKQGFNVTVFASSFNHFSRKETKFNGTRQKIQEEWIDGVRFIWLRTTPYRKNDWRRAANMLSYSYRVVKVGMGLKEQPHIVIGSSVHLLAALAGYILARIKHAFFVFEVRDLWPHSLVDLGWHGKRDPRIVALELLERFLYRKARRIIVLIAGYSDYIANLGIPPEKIIFIPNGVDAESLVDREIELPENLTQVIYKLKSKGKLIACYAGAHGSANGLEIVIEAAKVLADKDFDVVHFLLIGDGPQKNKLMETAKNYSLRNVTFCDPIPKAKMPSLLRKVNATLFTLVPMAELKYGISSNKLFDYMASAKPVICAANLTRNPVAEADCGILIPPSDPGMMAETFLGLTQLSSQELEDMGLRGRRYVLEHHSVPVLVDKLLAGLKDLST